MMKSKQVVQTITEFISLNEVNSSIMDVIILSHTALEVANISDPHFGDQLLDMLVKQPAGNLTAAIGKAHEVRYICSDTNKYKVKKYSTSASIIDFDDVLIYIGIYNCPYNMVHKWTKFESSTGSRHLCHIYT